MMDGLISAYLDTMVATKIIHTGLLCLSFYLFLLETLRQGCCTPGQSATGTSQATRQDLQLTIYMTPLKE